MMDKNAKDQQALDRATAAFSEHRELLFSIAYNILGEVADTEDALQETWLSWAAADQDQIGNVRSYLVRIAVNESLSRLRRVQRRRETYVGPWLPEPLITTGDAAEGALQEESVSMALMVVLETLTPLERAVFVLREAFGYSHTEIATILERTPSAVRQLAHRAREHVQARRPRVTVDKQVRKAATEQFLTAAMGGDLSALLEVLAPDVALWTDAGGRARAARRVVVGRDNVIRLITSDVVSSELADLSVRYADINGDVAAVMYSGDQLYGVGIIDLDDDGRRVRAIYSVVNPDKLHRIAEAFDLDVAPSRAPVRRPRPSATPQQR